MPVQAAELQDLLLDVMRLDGARVERPRLATLDDADWLALVELAARLRAAPMLQVRLRASGLDVTVPAAAARGLEAEHGRTTVRNLRLFQALHGIATALGNEGIRVIVLKGAFLAEAVYRNVAVRPMVDLDLLVRQEDLEAAARTLVRLDFRPRTPCDLEACVATMKHLPFHVHAKTGVAVELHWRLTYPGDHDDVEPGQFWERAVPATLGGAGVLALCPEDLLLHLCGHVAYQHRFGSCFLPFCDLAATVAHYERALRWEVVLERSNHWKWNRGVYVALRLARDWLGAAVPAGVLDALRPAGDCAAVLAVARQRVFDRSCTPTSTLDRGFLAKVWDDPSLLGKLRVLRDRVFVDQGVLAMDYGVDRDSPWLPLWYLVRLRDLAGRFVPLVWRLLRGRQETTRHVADRAFLDRWLEQE